MQIATITGTSARIEDSEIDCLRRSLRGLVLREGDSGYDEARIVFNGMFDSRPALIVRCRGTSDVVEAVRLAARHRLLTAVRAGGHSVAGNSTCEDGLVIDVSLMKSVMTDSERRLVRVDAGATWGDVDRETQAHGLATPGGIVSHTGVAGLALNGGVGWLRNKCGLTCDNMVSAELVTASSEVVRASASENSDLFWALRGGGGNFGVVTSFEFALHALGPLVAVVFSMYPIATTREVLKKWREWISFAPDEASTEILTWTAPATQSLPASVHNREIAIAAGVYAGDSEKGLQVLQPLREFGTPIGEIVAAIPYVALQTAFDANLPNTGEVIAYWKSLYLEHLTDEAIDIIADAAENRSSPSTMVFVQHLGGAIRRVRSTDMAFGTRNAAFVVGLTGDWRDNRESPRHIAWVRETWNRLAPHSTGAVYLNYLGREERDANALVRAAFGPNYNRLVETKTRYDPANLFRLNQNIPPRQG
jgi:FAD/FMN-containing dehydrogenase